MFVVLCSMCGCDCEPCCDANKCNPDCHCSKGGKCTCVDGACSCVNCPCKISK